MREDVTTWGSVIILRVGQEDWLQYLVATFPLTLWLQSLKAKAETHTFPGAGGIRPVCFAICNWFLLSRFSGF